MEFSPLASKTIEEERVRRLNDAESNDGSYLLYWMQQSQRAEFNPALEFAIQRANERRKPLVVGFGLTENYPDANLRHFQFLLEGLQTAAKAIERRGGRFIMRLGSPDQVAIELGRDADEVICDRGYVRHARTWRQNVAQSLDCAVWQVEGDAIVPVETASKKQEYAARTIRPKLHQAAPRFLRDLATTALATDDFGAVSVPGEDWGDISGLLRRLEVDRSVAAVDHLSGGTTQAKAGLRTFLSEQLSRYDDERQNVNRPSISQLSPYLHFGQISPVAVAIAVQEASGPAAAKDSFIEELLVRRELSINFVHYCADYDRLKCLPNWASETLNRHRDDPREHQYTATELENAETHDRAWNASMTQMKRQGYLHNHLRMYWGKKIIEWTNTPEHAHRTALSLNNKYFVDGRDTNSYSNVAWLFGLHDRAHQERKIFGKVRYMSAGGLKRKFDVDSYVKDVFNADLTSSAS